MFGTATGADQPTLRGLDFDVVEGDVRLFDHELREWGRDLYRRVGAYSNGMKMRLNFVRALIHDPGLVFLDEPTAGIDPGNARAVRAVVEDLREAGTTVFLTTHDMTVADTVGCTFVEEFATPG